MKWVIVGDIHGKIEIVEHFLSEEYKDFHKVFVGDYVDSFDRSVEDQVGATKMLLKAIQEGDKDVTALIGNHELSYIRDGMQCSGFRSKTNYHMSHLKQDILKWFKRHIYLTEDVLVTHSGATSQLFEDKDDVKNALEKDDKRLYNIGYARGGMSPHGGTFWCDYWKEFQNIEGLIQIVGHSSYRPDGEDKGIVMKNDCYNIDCLDRVSQALIVEETDDGVEIEIIEFM